MKIVKREKYESLFDFLKDTMKDHPYLKYHLDCDEFGCDVSLREKKWFGKTVCHFHYLRASVYMSEYVNDVVSIVRQWENFSGEEWEVTVP